MDSLSWEFHVSTLDDSNITEQPKVCLVCVQCMCVCICDVCVCVCVCVCVSFLVSERA